MDPCIIETFIVKSKADICHLKQKKSLQRTQIKPFFVHKLDKNCIFSGRKAFLSGFLSEIYFDF
ncbi:CLUMA_CG020597, isoform A [Clunio marinus]|uniref:CLUMA_CG020597, isoform A n=1 Tax=Clunio marinus TaxID=568069 RepID=A0A1J1J9E4_9DIPT|nr:CLUMA_CG020597, isoform A [Clunio marinus]